MKILQLELAAFGLFTDKLLDFSTGNPGLHVIYGANEAGKSTMRRAVTYLLFGIPERTTDAYLHANDQLRIGARLQNGNGEELSCYRRKGRKNTLLTSDNKALEEDCLQAFLGGMNEARFTALFCFDHDQLRQGGENLLGGGGNVGESLFEAGTGSLKVHEVLTQLDKEADELFKARGSKPLLNQTIRTYKEACKRMKDSSLSVNTWSEQAKKLDEARQQHTRLSQELRNLRTEQHRLERIQRTRPLLQRHQELRDEFANLASVIILPDNATKKRVELNLAWRNARHQEEQAQQDITKLQTQLAAITIPHALLAQKAMIDDLRGRLGSHQKAARDLPGVRTEMRTVEGETLSLLRRIYPQLELSEVSQVCVTNQQRERIKYLAEQFPALQEKQRSVTKRLEELTEQLIQQRQALAVLPLPPELTELQAALARALKCGDLEDLLVKEEKECRLLTVKADVSLKQLGLWTGTVELLEQMSLPGIERLESFDRRFKDIENDRRRIKERLLEARSQYERVTQQLNGLQWIGEIPTETTLGDARQARQQYWQKIKSSPQLPPARGGTEDLYRLFEIALLHADELVDRLRREAQRVAEYGMLLAEQQSTQREQEQQTKKWRLTEELIANLQREWEECWNPLGFKPWSPAEMRTWLSECLSLRQQVSVLRERRHNMEERNKLIADLSQELTDVLAKLPNVTPLSRLNDLIKQGQQTVTEVTNQHRTREYLEREIKTLAGEMQRAQTVQQQMTEALNRWHSDWVQVLAPLQLPADTLPEMVRSVLTTLDQVLNKIDKVNGLRRRIELMERDAQVFRQDVAALVQVIAPELVNEAAEHSVPELSSRLSQAEKDATRAEQLQQQLRAEQQRQQHAGQQVQTYQVQLQALLEQAHCSDLVTLEAAEQASSHKKEVQRELMEVEHQLREQGEGLSLTDLANAVATVDIDQLSDQLKSYQEKVQQVEQERSDIDQHIGELRTLLKQMDGNAIAARAADEAQLALAEIQQLSERYMQLHLAASVLRKSIDKYREQNQGPLLKRASELFQHFTLGGFCGLKTDYQSNDLPILLGLRTPDSMGIPTTGMSDGARDQLYLALRLASIERYVQKNSPLPLILDDILINFDDERSKATLEVLGEVSQQTQILFFTHHPRLVELAQVAVSSSNLVMHRI
jgi:uncharacterized protein YhaN